MRYVLLCAAAVLCSSCAATSGPVAPSAGHPQAGGDAPVSAPFREHCEASQSIVFETRTSAVLRGHVWFSEGKSREPIEGVQIAARELGSGAIRYSVTGPDGRFEVEFLPAGEHEVWTCFDGWDEMRFHLVVNPESDPLEVDVYLSPSDGISRQDLVFGGEVRSPSE